MLCAQLFHVVASQASNPEVHQRGLLVLLQPGSRPAVQPQGCRAVHHMHASRSIYEAVSPAAPHVQQSVLLLHSHPVPAVGDWRAWQAIDQVRLGQPVSLQQARGGRWAGSSSTGSGWLVQAGFTSWGAASAV
jgi:hypothetical protein